LPLATFRFQAQLAEVALVNPSTETSDDIIRQALESSGLTQGKTTSTFPLPASQQSQENGEGEGGVVAEGGGEEDDNEGGGAVQVSNVSNSEEAEVSAYMHVLPPHVLKEGEIATMQVHDSATGKMKRHLIRKVKGDCVGFVLVENHTLRSMTCLYDPSLKESVDVRSKFSFALEVLVNGLRAEFFFCPVDHAHKSSFHCLTHFWCCSLFSAGRVKT